MKDILNYISGWGSNIDTIDCEGEITHIYWEDEDNYYCAVYPHKGNNYKYMLRISLKETFDRWSVAEEERFFNTATDMIMYMIECI